MKQFPRILLLAAASPVFLASAVAAQESPMKFPSFNSINARPQGVAPGEAVTDPPQAPATPPAPAPKAAAAKPKPKPVKTAVKSETAVVKASETKGLSIAVLVNDEPITGYEIEQRQRIMGLGANIGEKAQASF